MAKDGPETSKVWLGTIFREMFRLMHNQEPDNFDTQRYPEEHRNAFFFENHANYLSFLVENAAPFHSMRRLLADEASRNLFDQLILYRLLGHAHVRLPAKGRRRAVPPEWKVDDTGDIGMFGPMTIFSVPYKGFEIWVKGGPSSVAATFLSDQYRFDRSGVRIGAEPGDYVIDGGCLGDTALAFAADVGDGGRVYTFDPMLRHCEIMREVFQMNSTLASRIDLFDVGLADIESERDAAHSNAGAVNHGARLQAGLPTRTIDGLVKANEIKRIDFIKLDVEGSELAALRGAKGSLERWRPKLAISLYHRPEDFFSMPLWLDSLHCGYRFFLDHYSIHHEETVLYATAASP